MPKTLSKAVLNTLKLFRVKGVVEISVVLAGPARMRTFNRDWRKKDRPTDVLSFGFWKAEGGIRRGEIVICLAVARAQARKLGIPLSRNIATLASHGTIHLLGIDHERSEKEYRLTMRAQEQVVNSI